jgi:NADH-quinone oxidoreductase subunit L
MRLSPVIQVSGTALAAVATLGAVTAFYAATAALAQRDIKRVLAYSTISQIGYMFMAVGAGSVSAGLFHLFVHAFFKALLFMAAGCVIQALHEEHDIFRMGGLMIRMPLVFWCFLAGALALAAAPGTGGFFSKDDVLAAVLADGSGLYTGLWILGEAAAFITAFYIFRVVCLVFLGEAGKEPAAVPAIMKAVLIPLAILSLVGGIINAPALWGGGERLLGLLAGQGIVKPAASPHGVLVEAVSASMSIAGIALSYYLYALNPALRERLALRHSALLDFLYNAWYLDRLYYKLFVTPYARVASFLWRYVDERCIDRAFDGAGEGFARTGTWLRRAVTGRASTYIFATAAGAAFILTYFAWRLG